MTWAQAVSSWRQGTGGVYLLRLSAGKLVGSGLFGVVWSVACMVGAVPEAVRSATGVIAVKGALGIRTWAAGFVWGGDQPVGFTSGRPDRVVEAFGPMAQQTAIVQTLRAGLGV